MDYTISEVLQYVAENDVKFIRLAFCDIFGTPKNISILSSELARAFSQGICFDASAVDGFMNVEESDLLLFPDPSTLAVLPWRPAQGRVIRMYCDIRHPDGPPFVGDGRYLLRQAVDKAAKLGYQCKIGAECEFYLFEMDDKGCPTHTPHDQAGYCDIAPLDKGENVRREICLTLEEMGIHPETSHHEQGPGQNEIDFQFSDPLSCADNLITFKSVVRNIAARNGLFATFMPKPIADKSGSGLHINLSLYKNGQNLFTCEDEQHNETFHHFIAGILAHVFEITLFLNPSTNSYARFGSNEAPSYITWSRENRSPLIRIPAARGDYSRMELRSPDPLCNPYHAFALLLGAGMEGIQNQLELCAPADFDLYTADQATLSKLNILPQNLGDAAKAAAESAFVSRHLPSKTIEKMVESKQNEWKTCSLSGDREKFEHKHYFTRL